VVGVVAMASAARYEAAALAVADRRGEDSGVWITSKVVSFFFFLIFLWPIMGYSIFCFRLSMKVDFLIKNVSL
jgi:hypothetical protein